MIKKFKLYIKESYLKNGDTINIGSSPIPFTPWYLKILGFKYQCAVYIIEDNPVLNGDCFEYAVKIKNKKLKWL